MMSNQDKVPGRWNASPPPDYRNTEGAGAMNGQPATYFAVTVNDRVMYRTDDVFGGTHEEAQQRVREVAQMIRRQQPTATITIRSGGRPQ
jgi:hypothetical protein